jgi:hypothetical protein
VLASFGGLVTRTGGAYIVWGLCDMNWGCLCCLGAWLCEMAAFSSSGAWLHEPVVLTSFGVWFTQPEAYCIVWGLGYANRGCCIIWGLIYTKQSCWHGLGAWLYDTDLLTYLNCFSLHVYAPTSTHNPSTVINGGLHPLLRGEAQCVAGIEGEARGPKECVHC